MGIKDELVAFSSQSKSDLGRNVLSSQNNHPLPLHKGEVELAKKAEVCLRDQNKQIFLVVQFRRAGLLHRHVFTGENVQAANRGERGQAWEAGGQVRAGELEAGQGGRRVAQDPRQLLPRQAGPPHRPRDQPQLRRLPRYRLRNLHLLPGKAFCSKVHQPTF